MTHPRHAQVQIVERFHPQQVLLFGSHAYGIPTPDSDADLLVVMETLLRNTECGIMIPPFDPDGDLPQGTHPATWSEFRERFCIFTGSEQRLRLCQQIQRMVEEARAAHIVERIIFGGSFVSSRAAERLRLYRRITGRDAL